MFKDEQGFSTGDETPFTDVILSENAQEGVRFRYKNGIEVVHKSGNDIWFHGTDGKVFVNRGKFGFWLGEQQKAKNLGSANP